MAIVKIQHRRGNYADYDPSKVLPGELVVTQADDPNSTDGEAVYIATTAGNVKQLATMQDMQSVVDTAIEGAISSVTERVEEYIEEIEATGNEVLDSIPADYTQLSEDVDTLKDDLTQTNERIDDIEPGLSEDAKAALLACFQHIAFLDDDDDYYTNLRDALYASDELVSLSAVFNQGSTVIYPDELIDNLRTMLVVTGLYTDGNTKGISDYRLSGTLVGDTLSVITVSYRDKTTTFAVAVTEYEWGSDYTWLYRADTDGLLSENENVSAVAQGGSPVETVSDGILNVKTIGDAYNIYKLIPLTSTNASIKAKLRFNKLPIATYPTGPRLQVSNGTTGAQLFAKKHNETGHYVVVTNAGAVQPVVADNIVLNQWYILGCELRDGKQIISVDGNESTYDALSSYACTETRFIVQSPNTLENNETDVDVAWIAFKSNDE